MRERFGRSALDYGVDGAMSGPVKVSYFDPRTGKPCAKKPRPLHSAEEREAIRAAAEAAAKARGGRPVRPVVVDGVVYESIAAAARAMGASPSTLGSALRKGAAEYSGHEVSFA